MISIVNTECHVPKTFSDLAKIAAWGRLGLIDEGVADERARLIGLHIYVAPRGRIFGTGMWIGVEKGPR